MAYALPPNNLIPALFADTPAATERRRKLLDQDAKLKGESYLNVDPGRGPVRR